MDTKILLRSTRRVQNLTCTVSQIQTTHFSADLKKLKLLNTVHLKRAERECVQVQMYEISSYIFRVLNKVKLSACFQNVLGTVRGCVSIFYFKLSQHKISKTTTVRSGCVVRLGQSACGFYNICTQKKINSVKSVTQDICCCDIFKRIFNTFTPTLCWFWSKQDDVFMNGKHVEEAGS